MADAARKKVLYYWLPFFPLQVHLQGVFFLFIIIVILSVVETLACQYCS